MAWYQVLIGAVLIVVSIAIVAVVLLQESRSAGLSGAISGGADTFLGKNKSKTVESKLVLITKIGAGIFFALALISTLVVLFF